MGSKSLLDAVLKGDFKLDRSSRHWAVGAGTWRWDAGVVQVDAVRWSSDGALGPVRYDMEGFTCTRSTVAFRRSHQGKVNSTCIIACFKVSEALFIMRLMISVSIFDLLRPAL